MAYYTSCKPHKFFFTPAKNGKLTDLTESFWLTLPFPMMQRWNVTATPPLTIDGKRYFGSLAEIEDEEYGSYGKVKNYEFDNSHLVWKEKTTHQGPVVSYNATWTDGNNIYYSNAFRFDIEKQLWEKWIPYPGITDWFEPDGVWTDGQNIYYSHYASGHYKLNKNEKRWEQITWTGWQHEDFFQPRYVWTDGSNFYYSQGKGLQYRIDITNQEFILLDDDYWTVESEEEWYPYGNEIYTDGYDVYYGCNFHYLPDQRKFEKTEIPLDDVNQSCLWSNGKYLFSGNSVLKPKTAKIFFRIKNEWSELNTSKTEKYDGSFVIG